MAVKCENSITKFSPSPYLSHYVAITVAILLLSMTAQAQTLLPEQDINDLVAAYKIVNPKAEVAKYQSRMPSPVSDEKLRKAILEALPPVVLKLQINNAQLSERVRKLFEPLLKLYNREKVYEIIIFKHSTPVLFSDTGVVLVISTGMIKRAKSNDEILGYLAHEVAHE